MTRVLQRVETTSDRVLLPLVGETWRDLRTTTELVAGPTLSGDGLVASAVCLSADGRALLLRVSNVTEAAVSGAWTMPSDGPWVVTLCRLDETPLGPSIVRTAMIPLHAAPRALVTLRVERAAN